MCIKVFFYRFYRYRPKTCYNKYFLFASCRNLSEALTFIVEYKDISTLPGYGRLRAVSLFLQILCEGSLHARVSSGRETRDPRRKRRQHLVFLRASLVSRLQSRAWSLACLARFARCTKKKERLLVVYGYGKLP